MMYEIRLGQQTKKVTAAHNQSQSLQMRNEISRKEIGTVIKKYVSVVTWFYARPGWGVLK
jgi:hypothetical protein